MEDTNTAEPSQQQMLHLYRQIYTREKYKTRKISAFSRRLGRDEDR